MSHERPAQSHALYHGHYLLPVGLVHHEVELVRGDDQDLGEVVTLDPAPVEGAQAQQVVVAYGGLVLAAAQLDVPPQRVEAGVHVDQQVRRPEGKPDRLVHLQVAAVVAAREDPLLVQVAGEDRRVLVDRPVLNDPLAGVHLGEVLLQALAQEEHLRVEGVGAHVLVEVLEVGVLLDGLVDGRQVEGFREDAGEARLAGPDVAGDGYVHGYAAFACERISCSRSWRSCSCSTKSMLAASTTLRGPSYRLK